MCVGCVACAYSGWVVCGAWYPENKNPAFGTLEIDNNNTTRNNINSNRSSNNNSTDTSKHNSIISTNRIRRNSTKTT